ncbi:Endo-1,4-beta-xylanase A precursor [compost metagenome]
MTTGKKKICLLVLTFALMMQAMWAAILPIAVTADTVNTDPAVALHTETKIGDDSIESITDVVYAIGWTGNLSKVTSTQLINVPTRSIYAEIWIDNVTGKTDQIANLKVQLGYKLAEGEHDFAWSDAVYAGATGNNDRYKANFTPDQVGIWKYTMRVSGDGGNTWVSSGESTLKVVGSEDELTPLTINSLENLTDLNDRLMIGNPTPDILGEIYVEGITDEPGQGKNIKAQLGYKIENDTDYVWVDAEYLDEVGSKDRYKANFTPDRAGKWYYAMRFSLNNGATWENRLLGYKVNKFYDDITIKKPYDVTLTWSQDPKTTQTITWKTTNDISDGVVQFAKQVEEGTFPGESRSIAAVTKPFHADMMHTVTLTELEPGTTYVYRVGNGTQWSDIFTFTTESEATAPFSFFVFGDSQSGRQEESDYAKWGETVNTAYQTHPDAKFFMNLGDLVELDSSYAHWHKWFEGAEGVIEKIPQMSATGNHEYYAGYNANQLADNYIAQFNLPQNGPDRLKGTVYSFDYGDVHFVVLNSQQAEANVNLPNPMGDILQEQKEWLENDLKSTEKKWKVVLYHKASYYSRASRDKDAEPIKQAFQSVFDKYKVDVVFSAHDHTVTRSYPINNNNFVNSPAEGTVYYLVGRTGNKNYSDPIRQVWNAYYLNDTEDTNYVHINVDGDQLTISMQEKNGKLLDQYSIDKAKGTGTPAEELPKIQIDKVDKLSAFEEKKKVGDTVSVFAEVNAANVTNYVGRGVHILAQLGYKKEGQASYTWVDASYSKDSGKNDMYGASFVPNSAGVWNYAMRFSGDAGATWTMTDPKSLTVAGDSSQGDNTGGNNSGNTNSGNNSGSTSSGSKSSSAGSTTNPSTPTANDKNPVLTLEPTVEKTADGKSVATAALEGAVLTQALGKIQTSSGAANPRLVIELTGKEPIGKIELPSDSLSALLAETQSLVLSMVYGNTTYDLPLQTLNIPALVKALEADSRDVKISIVIEQVSGAHQAALEAKVKQSGMKLVASAYDFQVIASAGGKQIKVNDFGKRYISRTIELDRLADTGKTTAILFDPTANSITFVPALFAKKDAKTIATLKRSGNSIYAIVENTKTFSDLTNHWSRADVELMASKLVIQGVTDTDFKPQSQITRAEFAAMLTRALGLSETDEVQFTDVKSTDWFAGAVGAASKAGMVEGFENGAFQPNAGITREQMAVMISRAMNVAGQSVTVDQADLARFKDSGAISGWAKEAVAQSINTSILNGMTDNSFVPQAQATRAEAAVVLKRMLQYVQFMN